MGDGTWFKWSIFVFMKETLLTFSQMHWFSSVEAGPNLYYIYHLQASYMTENPTVLSRKPTLIKMTEKSQRAPLARTRMSFTHIQIRWSVSSHPPLFSQCGASWFFVVLPSLLSKPGNFDPYSKMHWTCHIHWSKSSKRGHFIWRVRTPTVDLDNRGFSLQHIFTLLGQASMFGTSRFFF